MELFMYTADKTEQTYRMAEQIIETVMDLSSGPNPFLPPDATIWASARHSSTGIWVLAEDSSHVRVFHAIKAGAARINRTSVRFGENTTKTLTDPLAEFRISGIPSLSGETHSTLLINHSQQEKHTLFIAGSAKIHPINGKCVYDPFTVIDLNHYTRPEKSTTDSFKKAHAMVAGTELMCQGLQEDVRQFVMENVESFRVPLEKTIESSAWAKASWVREVSARRIVDTTVNQATTAGMPAIALLDSDLDPED